MPDFLTTGYSRRIYSLSIGGRLDVPALPASGLGAEIAPVFGAISVLQARRGVPGSSGTTTVVLEINGTPISPTVSVSWTPSDAAYAVKGATFGPVRVSAADRVSLRLTSAEVSGEDVYCEVS